MNMQFMPYYLFFFLILLGLSALHFDNSRIEQKEASFEYTKTLEPYALVETY